MKPAAVILRLFAFCAGEGSPDATESQTKLAAKLRLLMLHCGDLNHLKALHRKRLFSAFNISREAATQSRKALEAHAARITSTFIIQYSKRYAAWLPKSQCFLE